MLRHYIAAFLLLSVIAPASFCLSCNTTASGLWQNSGIWDCGVVPDSDDSVKISHSVYVNAAVTTGDVNITSGGNLSGLAYDMSFSSLVVYSGGTFNATSKTTTITSSITVGSGYPYQLYAYATNGIIHNNGIMVLAGGDNTRSDTGTNHLYNFVRNGAGYCYSSTAMLYVDNDMNITGGGFSIYYGGEAHTVNGNLNVAAGAFLHMWTISTSSRVIVWKNLTVAGTFNTPAGGVNVSGDTIASGTISFPNGGFFLANGSVTLNSGAVFGSNTAYSLYNNAPMFAYSGATLNAPNASGTWRMNHQSPPWYFLLGIEPGSTFNNNGGTLRIEGPYGGENDIHWVASGTLNNLVINGPMAVYVSVGDLLVSGNLTILRGQLRLDYGSVPHNVVVNGTTMVNGTLYPGDYAANQVLTFNGPVIVNSSGYLGSNTAYSINVNSSLTNYGAFRAPNNSGTWNQNGNFVNYGGFYNNSGTARFIGNAYVIGVDSTWPFNNLITNPKTNVTIMADGLYVANASWVNGLLDARQNALGFNGVNSYGWVAHSALLEPPSITVEFWAKLNSDGTRHVVVTKWNGYTTEVNGDGTFKWGLAGLTGQYFGNQQISFNRWHHLVGTFNDTTKVQCTYIDGVLSECQAPTGSISYSSAPLQFSWSSETNGILDEVRIYNRSLSPAEIADHYRNAYLNEAGLVGKWRFSEGSGNTTQDESGLGNTGTLYNSPTWVLPNLTGGYFEVGNGGTFNATSGTTNIGGMTKVYGNFSGSDGPIILGSAYVGNYMWVEGNFNGGSGPNTIRGMWIVETGSTVANVTLTSGTTTINGYGNGGWTIYKSLNSKFNPNGGTFNFVYGGVGYLGGSDLTFYNLSISAGSIYIAYSNPATYINTTVIGNLTINGGYAYGGTNNNAISNITVRGQTIISSGSLDGSYPAGGGLNITLNGPVTINSGGTLGSNTGYNLDVNAALTINSGGAFSAPNASGTFTFGKASTVTDLTINSGGTFTLNNGRITFTDYIDRVNIGVPAGVTFYDVTVSALVTFYAYTGGNTIQHNLAVSSGGTMLFFVVSADSINTIFGTPSSAATIVNNGVITFGRAGAGGTQTIQAASAAYPAVCTGNDWDWDSNIADPLAVKWLDYRTNATTGGGGVNLTFTGNMTVNGFNVSGGDILNVTSSQLTASRIAVLSNGQAWLDNVSESIDSISATGNLYRYLTNYPLRVVNGSGTPINGASINVTDSCDGSFRSGTTNAAGWWYPRLYKSVTNVSGTRSYLDNLSASYGGQWNSILVNSTRGNHTIVLGASQGYSVIGGAISGGFSPNVTVDGTPFAGPYSGTRTVELRNASQLVATFPHNFSSGDFDMNTVTVRLGQYWVGFAGRGATLYVPLRGTYCNVRTCSGITNASENCGAGWNTTDSEIQGWYCVLTINGTVAEEQGDPAITKLVAAPIRWELVAVLFGAAALIFVASGAKLRLRTTKRGRH